MPPMVGGVFYEHGHRMVASAVGFLTLVLAVWTARAESRAGLRRLAWVALAAVIAQGVLGGLTVIFLLPTPISVDPRLPGPGVLLHDDRAGLRHLARMARGDAARPTTWPACARRRRRRRPPPSSSSSWARSCGTSARGSPCPISRACSDAGFPLSTSSTRRPCSIHLAHRAGALVVFALVLRLALRAGRSGDARFALPARLALVLVLVQVALGAATVLTGKAVIPTTAHVATGRRDPGPLLVRHAARPAPPPRRRPLAGRGRGPRRSGSLVSASVVVARRAAAADYLELTKPRITLTVVMTALVGYVMARPQPGRPSPTSASPWPAPPWSPPGASALNMLLERRTDALMLRTRNRPVAAGRLRAGEALAFGLALTVAGLGILRFGAGAPGRRRRPRHLGDVPLRLHAAQDADVALHDRRRVPRRPAPRHRMGGRARPDRAGRGRPLRDPLPVADPALPRHRLDLSRGLRARRSPHAARARSGGGR